MANGDPLLQIAYNSGFTALSVFVPILVLLGAFLAVGTNDSVGLTRITLGGTLAGFATCGMHYIGQAGIANYTSVYSIAAVVGSVVISVIATTTALIIFFVLRAAWTNSWWKRVLCAVLLAGGVSGMHWLASVGTQYRYREPNSLMRSSISRDETVIIVIALSFAACAMLLVVAIVAQRRRQQSANRAKQVVLACATFDPEGRLLVTPEGLLPSQKITNSYIERSFDDVFSISHPAFLWVFRASRNWRSLSTMVMGIRRHLSATVGQIDPVDQKDTARSSFDESTNGSEDFSILFRKLFCVAAADLATQISEPLDQLGVLYDEIMNTGTVPMSRKMKIAHSLRPEHGKNGDVELGTIPPAIFGRGQVLFVVRRTNKMDAARLQARGFRFASIQNVSEILARALQVDNAALFARIESMRNYSKSDQIMPAGVHLGYFAIRARISGGWDVLVRREAKNRLPTIQLPIRSLKADHLALLKQLGGLTVANCRKRLQEELASNLHDDLFATPFYDALIALSDQVADPLIHEALLVAETFDVPCRPVIEGDQPGQATLIACHIVVPIHSREQSSWLQYSPLNLFHCQQRVYSNSPHHETFAQQMHGEFTPFVRTRPTSGSSDSFPRLASRRPRLPSRGKGSHGSWWGSLQGLERLENDAVAADTVSEKGLMRDGRSNGIMVRREISVDIRDSRTEQPRLGRDHVGCTGLSSSEVGGESWNFVDRLFAISIEGRAKTW
ncbi:MAG: hypothetical protein M1817_003936 [Caeruleum heppii]|nr:MAG: hypothetical protein M1817_003936 [Caeruleum heppii]